MLWPKQIQAIISFGLIGLKSFSQRRKDAKKKKNPDLCGLCAFAIELKNGHNDDHLQNSFSLNTATPFLCSNAAVTPCPGFSTPEKLPS